MPCRMHLTGSLNPCKKDTCKKAAEKGPGIDHVKARSPWGREKRDRKKIVEVTDSSLKNYLIYWD